MRTSLTYAGCDLDRSARCRCDDAWLDARLRDPDTRLLPVWRDRNLVVSGEVPAAAALAGPLARETLDLADHWALLGLDGDGRAWLTADLSKRESEALEPIRNGAEFVDLRRVGPVLRGQDGAVLAYARGMMTWHRRNRFCGACGAPTESRDGGHVRRCTNPECGDQQFPRTDPAVIVLVTRPGGSGSEEACLLARQARWPKGMMSTLAGFVEPGENLEETVVREILEETGVCVDAVRYQGSQPWPFPSSLMVAFRARAEPGAPVSCDGEELEDARWFTRTDVADFARMGLKLPRRDSIARWMVDTWLAEGEDQKP